MLADFDQLAVGFFVSPANGNLEHRNGGPTGMDVLNVRFATAETFRVWAEVPVAEVWQWVALATFRDPSTVPPEAALSRHVRKRSAARLFQDRVTTLGRLVKHLGALQCVSVAADGKRSLVRLGDFREWSKGVGLSLPLEFPRPSGGSKVSARRGAAARFCGADRGVPVAGGDGAVVGEVGGGITEWGDLVFVFIIGRAEKAILI